MTKPGAKKDKVIKKQGSVAEEDASQVVEGVVPDLNSAHRARVADALATFLNSEHVEPQFATLQPIGFSQNAVMSSSKAPFTKTHFTQGMRANNWYEAGCNLFWIDSNYSPTLGGLTKEASIDELLNGTFAQPADIPTQVIALPDATPIDTTNVAGTLECLSPPEFRDAAIIAAARDCEDHTKALAWVKVFLSATFRFEIITGETDKFFHAEQLRETKIGQGVAVQPSASEYIYKIISLKLRWERDNGFISAVALAQMWQRKVKQASVSEQISDTMVYNCIRIWNTALRHPNIRSIITTADSNKHTKSLMNSVNLLFIVVQKAKTTDNIAWLLECLVDVVLNGQKDCHEIGSRTLAGTQAGKGLADFFLRKKAIKSHLLGEFMDAVKLSSQKVRQKFESIFGSFAGYRAAVPYKKTSESTDLSFQATWTPGDKKAWTLYEALLFTNEYDVPIMQCVKDRKGVQDTFDHTSLVEAIQSIVELQEATIKAKKDATESAKPEKTADNSGPVDDGSAPVDFLEMKIIDATGAKKDLAVDLRTAVLPFQKEARRFTRSCIKLIPEPAREVQLADELRACEAAQLKGGKAIDACDDADGGKDETWDYFAVIAEVRTSGESATRPALRHPPMQPDFMRKLLKGALLSRVPIKGSEPPELDEDALQDGDQVVFMDGGKHGLEGVFNGYMVGGNGTIMKKTKKCLTLLMSEESLKERRQKVKFSTAMTLPDIECVHSYVNSRNGFKLGISKRQYYEGTSMSSYIGPIVLPAWTDCWKMKFEEKKKLFDKHRVAVGGRDELSGGKDIERRQPEDIEPVFYHTLPTVLWRQLIHSNRWIGAIHLTVGDGDFDVVSEQ